MDDSIIIIDNDQAHAENNIQKLENFIQSLEINPQQNAETEQATAIPETQTMTVFDVEDFLGHLTYEEAFELRHELTLFYPDCAEKMVHSKYVFHTKWLGYPVDESTWEPEENVMDVEMLKEYKKKHGLPESHEQFKKKFTWVVPAVVNKDSVSPSDSITPKRKRGRPPRKSSLDTSGSGGSIERGQQKKPKKVVIEDDSDDEPPVSRLSDVFSPETATTSTSVVDDNVVTETSQQTTVCDSSTPSVAKPVEATVSREAPETEKELVEISEVVNLPVKTSVVDQEPTRMSETTDVAKERPKTTEAEKKKKTTCEKDKENTGICQKPSKTSGNRLIENVIRYTVEEVPCCDLEEQAELLKSRRWSSTENLNERWNKAISWKAEEEARNSWVSAIKEVVKHAAEHKEIDPNVTKAQIFMTKHRNVKTGKLGWRVKGAPFRSFLKSLSFQCVIPIVETPSISIQVSADKSESSTTQSSTNSINEDPNSLLSKEQMEKVKEDLVKMTQNLNEKHQIELDTDMLSLVEKIAIQYASLQEMDTAILLREIQDKGTRFYVICELVGCVRIQVLEKHKKHPDIEDNLVKRFLCSEYLFTNQRNVLNTTMDICEKRPKHRKCLMIAALISCMSPQRVFCDIHSPFHQDNFGFTMIYGSQCQKVYWILHGVPASRCVYHMKDVNIYATPFFIALRQRNTRYLLDFLVLGIDLCSRGYTKDPLTSEKDVFSWTHFVTKLISTKQELLSDPSHVDPTFEAFIIRHQPLCEKLLKTIVNHMTNNTSSLLQRVGLYDKLGGFCTAPLIFRVTRPRKYTSLTTMRDSTGSYDGRTLTLKNYLELINTMNNKTFLVVLPICLAGGATARKQPTQPLTVVKPETVNSRIISASLDSSETHTSFDLPLVFSYPNDGYVFAVSREMIDKFIDLDLFGVTLTMEGERNDLFVAQIVCIYRNKDAIF